MRKYSIVVAFDVDDSETAMEALRKLLRDDVKTQIVFSGRYTHNPIDSEMVELSR
jgi:hypothetical protein